MNTSDKRAIELLVMSNSDKDMAPCWFYILMSKISRRDKYDT